MIRETHVGDLAGKTDAGGVGEKSREGNSGGEKSLHVDG